MESWDYANLSKAAKAAGGPEELAKELFEAGVAEGKKTGAPIYLGAGVLGGAVIAWGVGKIQKAINKHKKEKEAEIEELKEELVDSIGGEEMELSENGSDVSINIEIDADRSKGTESAEEEIGE